MIELKISFMLEQYPLWFKCPNVDLHYYEALIKGFHLIYYSCVQNDYYIAFYVDYLMRKSRYFPIIAPAQSFKNDCFSKHATLSTPNVPNLSHKVPKCCYVNTLSSSVCLITLSWIFMSQHEIKVGKYYIFTKKLTNFWIFEHLGSVLATHKYHHWKALCKGFHVVYYLHVKSDYWKSYKSHCRNSDVAKIEQWLWGFYELLSKFKRTGCAT